MINLKKYFIDNFKLSNESISELDDLSEKQLIYLLYLYKNNIKTNKNIVNSSLLYDLNISQEKPISKITRKGGSGLCDIDTDFPDNKRDEVVQYVSNKYGQENVTRICTFGTMAARVAIKDVGRVHGIPFQEMNEFAKLIPDKPVNITLKDAYEKSTELQIHLKENKKHKEIFELAKKLEGCIRHVSVHACAIVIAPHNISEVIPIQYAPKDDKTIITQFDANDVQALGYLKMDFLGLKNLSIIDTAKKIIKRTTGKDIDIYNLPLNDKDVFNSITSGATTGVFQFESQGMTNYLKELKPTEIEDLVAMVALYRPGPMDSIPTYIQGKHGKKKLEYLHPKLEPILNKTFAIPVYQEQLMAIANNIAGFTLGQGYLLIKAIGKKNSALLKDQEEKFINGCIKTSNFKKEEAVALWKFIEPFANYGFNRCVLGDTLILNSDSGKYISIEEIYNNKVKNINTLKVYSMNEENLRIEKSKVLDIYYNGIKPIYRLIVTKDGINKKIKCTKTHRFYTKNGWKEYKDILIGDLIAIPKLNSTSCKNKELKKIEDSKISWGNVIDMQYCGSGKTYDLEVEKNHNYIANNIIVHNSHAVAYGLTAYITAYLKNKYPVEFMTALMSADAGDMDKIKSEISECRTIGIEVLPPDINVSRNNFTASDNKIRLGLSAIKGLGNKTIDSIIESREKYGEFKNIEDFLSRTFKTTKSLLIPIAKSGALNKFCDPRQIVDNIENITEFAKNAKKEVAPRISLFDTGSSGLSLSLPNIQSTKEERMAWEYEILGIFLSGNPLDYIENELKLGLRISDITKDHIEKDIRIGGYVVDSKIFLTKKGSQMASIMLDDGTGKIEIVLFPEQFEKYRSYVKNNSVIFVSGKVSERNEVIQIISNRIEFVKKI